MADIKASMGFQQKTLKEDVLGIRVCLTSVMKSTQRLVRIGSMEVNLVSGSKA